MSDTFSYLQFLGTQEKQGQVDLTRWPRLSPVAAPTDPYVRALAHTVPQNKASLCDALRRLTRRGSGSG